MVPPTLVWLKMSASGAMVWAGKKVEPGHRPSLPVPVVMMLAVSVMVMFLFCMARREPVRVYGGHAHAG